MGLRTRHGCMEGRATHLGQRGATDGPRDRRGQGARRTVFKRRKRCPRRAGGLVNLGAALQLARTHPRGGLCREIAQRWRRPRSARGRRRPATGSRGWGLARGRATDPARPSGCPRSSPVTASCSFFAKSEHRARGGAGRKDVQVHGSLRVCSNGCCTAAFHQARCATIDETAIRSRMSASPPLLGRTAKWDQGSTGFCGRLCQPRTRPSQRTRAPRPVESVHPPHDGEHRALLQGYSTLELRVPQSEASSCTNAKSLAVRTRMLRTLR